MTDTPELKPCPICELRRENDVLREKREVERKKLQLCWIAGGMTNNDSETTIITIDVKITAEHKKELSDLLHKIEDSAPLPQPPHSEGE